MIYSVCVSAWNPIPNEGKVKVTSLGTLKYQNTCISKTKKWIDFLIFNFITFSWKFRTLNDSS